MTVGQKVNVFIQKTKARIKGDTAKLVALKNFERADAIFKMQIAQLELEKMRAESNRDKALEMLEEAIHPTELINDDQQYVDKIQRVEKEVVLAEKGVKNIIHSIEYFTKLRVDSATEVDDIKDESEKEK